MCDAVREVKGFNPGIPEWCNLEMAEEDPAIYEQYAPKDDTLSPGDNHHQPHRLRGLEMHGMYIVANAAGSRRF